MLRKLHREASKNNIMINGLLTDIITVSRRTSTGRDALNNPIYGSPTDGAGWSVLYPNIKCKIAFSNKEIDFSPLGERVKPAGVIYIDKRYLVKQEDRVTTKDGIQYNVIGMVEAKMGAVVMHRELTVQLP